MRWTRGQVIALRELYDGRTWSERPVTGVEDRGREVAVWCSAGTRWRASTIPPRRSREATRAERFITSMRLGDWMLKEFVWDTNTLGIFREHDWYATWLRWSRDQAFLGWYVNFQLPMARGEDGSIETMDLMLDLIVEPSGDYTWKDEDEFERLRDAEVLLPEWVDGVSNERARVLKAVEGRDGVFSRSTRISEWRLPAGHQTTGNA